MSVRILMVSSIIPAGDTADCGLSDDTRTTADGDEDRCEKNKQKSETYWEDNGRCLDMDESFPLNSEFYSLSSNSIKLYWIRWARMRIIFSIIVGLFSFLLFLFLCFDYRTGFFACFSRIFCVIFFFSFWRSKVRRPRTFFVKRKSKGRESK